MKRLFEKFVKITIEIPIKNIMYYLMSKWQFLP